MAQQEIGGEGRRYDNSAHAFYLAEQVIYNFEAWTWLGVTKRHLRVQNGLESFRDAVSGDDLGYDLGIVAILNDTEPSRASRRIVFGYRRLGDANPAPPVPKAAGYFLNLTAIRTSYRSS